MRVGQSTKFAVAALSALLGFCLMLLSIYLPAWVLMPESWPVPRIITLSAGILLFLLSIWLFILHIIQIEDPEVETLEEDDVHACLNELKQLKEKLLEQEKLVQVGLLTAGIAHEIKNPLSFVTNFSTTSVEMLDELQTAVKTYREDPSEKNKEALESLIDDLLTNIQKIAEHGQRAQSIVMNMLMQSRSEQTLEKEWIDVNALLEEYVNLAYHGLRAQDANFNIKIEKSLNDNAGKVFGVGQSIGRVFLNILNNGMYAAYKRSEKEKNHKPLIEISSSGDANQSIISIKDNGVGIDKDNLKNIFKPFFTTKPKGHGTGLGLSICHDVIVNEHQGDIQVHSQPDKYTEFKIILPKSKKSSQEG